MTIAGSEEYVTDVPYMRCFVSDLSPATLRLVAALNGFPPPLRDDFTFCELGSAHGDTLATLAAAYPRARFFGVDINPTHIASANRLASEGGLANARFLEQDFEELLRRDGESARSAARSTPEAESARSAARSTPEAESAARSTPDHIPELDFVAAHGVLSWVGPAKRKAIVDFASAKLKRGGLLYVGYNALPGWAAVEPLRQLMLDRGAAVGGSSLERAREGLAFAKLLRDGGAAYFTGNPAASEMLATMERTGLAYVVHEYLHAHWVPMYFTQVAAEMAERDLYFVGQLPLHLNYRDLAIPATLAGVFKNVTDRITFETLKDYATNQFFRRDVFIKGRVPRDEAAATAYLESTPFGTLTREGPAARDVRLPHHTLHFAGAVFDALLPALAAGATTVAELARSAPLSAFGPARLRDAVVRLALAGQVAPTIDATRAAQVPPSARRFHVASEFNRMMLREGSSGDAPIVLASTVAGTGVPVPMLDGIALRLLTEIPEREWHTWIGELVRRHDIRLKVGDRAVEDHEERIRVLLAQVESFRAERLPRLIELGIVAGEATLAG